jgi:hypothetical protein
MRAKPARSWQKALEFSMGLLLPQAACAVWPPFGLPAACLISVGLMLAGLFLQRPWLLWGGIVGTVLLQVLWFWIALQFD